MPWPPNTRSVLLGGPSPSSGSVDLSSSSSTHVYTNSKPFSPSSNSSTSLAFYLLEIRSFFVLILSHIASEMYVFSRFCFCFCYFHFPGDSRTMLRVDFPLRIASSCCCEYCFGTLIMFTCLFNLEI
jgi:hypothetical protein